MSSSMNQEIDELVRSDEAVELSEVCEIVFEDLLDCHATQEDSSMLLDAP